MTLCVVLHSQVQRDSPVTHHLTDGAPEWRTYCGRTLESWERVWLSPYNAARLGRTCERCASKC